MGSTPFLQDRKPTAAFANAASYQDAGDRAARQYLHLDLGACVAAMFDASSPADWAPRMEAMKDGARDPAVRKVGSWT